jgi:drug/metabolite transporter (DMT)-like permease
MFVGGGILYVASFLLWMYILSKAQVTYAYPVSVALTILFTTLGATLVLREQFTWLMFLGIFLVICGIAALTIKTAQ